MALSFLIVMAFRGSGKNSYATNVVTARSARVRMDVCMYLYVYCMYIKYACTYVRNVCVCLIGCTGYTEYRELLESTENFFAIFPCTYLVFGWSHERWLIVAQTIVDCFTDKVV